MKKLIASTITIALLATAPASAQLLGGSGGIGGSLGGSLGGGLGSNIGSGPETIGQAGGTLTGRGDVASSTQVDRTVDTRSGRVATDANNNSSANGSLLGGVGPMNNVASGAANGSASGSANGSSDTTLLGTDAVRSTAGQAIDTARNSAGSARSAASGAASTGAGTARNAVAGAMGAGSLAGSAAGNGMAMGNLGQLAASGSTAATADGMFAIAPGMPIEDPKGRVIGYVQEVRQSGSGVVNSVIVESGNRTATLPAADFAGSGDVLVTGMSKGQIKQAAKQQEKTPAAETNQ
jgi:hypothetical protein